METQISCPSCQQALSIDSAWAGHQVDCPVCQSPFIVPQAPVPVARILPQLSTSVPPSHQEPTVSSVKLWNPNAAINWSVVFSPLLGTYLHYQNWLALGDTKQASAAKAWFIAAIFLVVIGIVAVVAAPESQFGPGLGLVFLIAWYFGQAKGQAAFVKTHFGTSYTKRSWVLPLGVACIGLFLVAGVFTRGDKLKLERTAVELTNQNLQRTGAVDSSIRCVRVELGEEITPGRYDADAFFSNGARVSLFVERYGNRMSVELSPLDVASKLMVIKPEDLR